MPIETNGTSCRKATQLNHCGSGKNQLESDPFKKAQAVKSLLEAQWLSSLALTGRDVASKETSKRECWHHNNTFPVRLVRHLLLRKTLRSGTK